MSRETDTPPGSAVDDGIIQAVFVSRLRPSPQEAWQGIGSRYASLARGALVLAHERHDLPADPAAALKYGVALVIEALQRSERTASTEYVFDERALEALLQAASGPAETLAADVPDISHD